MSRSAVNPGVVAGLFVVVGASSSTKREPGKNGIPKVVCSRSLVDAPWGEFAPARIERDAVSYLHSVRSSFTGHVLIWGSLSIVHDLLSAGELDELDLFVAPVALGQGVPLLPSSVTNLRQLEVEAFPGAVHVRYAVG